MHHSPVLMTDDKVERNVQVSVRDNNVDQALRALELAKKISKTSPATIWNENISTLKGPEEKNAARRCFP